MLTEKQQEAFVDYKQWLRSSSLFARLKGYAGTGKTFTTKSIITEARKIIVSKFDHKTGELEDRPMNICVTAPTHTAKEVAEDVTGITGRTIQSLIGLAPNMDIENFDINNPEFAIKNNPGMPNFDFVIIDEASMVNKGLLKLIQETAEEHGVKILFVYDYAQLPPVGEDDIPVDNLPLDISHELTEVIRTGKENPILDTFTEIRKNLSSTRDTFSHASRYSPDKQMGEHYIRDVTKFQVQVVKRFWELFQRGEIHTDKVLAWSNKAVSKWNSLIRASIKNAAKDTSDMGKFFLKDELIISDVNIKDTIIKKSKEFVVTNPEFVLVKFDYYVRDKDGKINELSPPEQVELRCIKTTLRSLKGGQLIDVQFLVPEKDNYIKFAKVFNWYHSLGVYERKWERYYEWKNQIMLLEDLVSAKGKKLCGKDFDYSYAITIHKSQGSSYNNVFIDEIDIDQLEDTDFVRFIYNEQKKKNKTLVQKAFFEHRYPNFTTFYNKQQELKNRLKYVAMSRCRKFMLMLTKK